MKHTTPALAALFLAALAVSPVSAQEADAALADGRWMPFLGCWVDAAADDGMTCVVPEGQGVAFLTVSDDGEVTDREVVVAGVERTVEEVGCTGTELVEFSSDGHRLFTRTRLDCGGTTRHSRGLLAMVGGDQWIDVRALEGGDGSMAWVSRYRAAPDRRVRAAGFGDGPGEEETLVLRAARLAASSIVSVDDLIEAHDRTDAEAVRSWVVEQERPLPLHADALVRLADAGVSSEVIDVAVAVSFPEHFEVDREVRDESGYAYARPGYGRSRCGALGLWQPYSWYYCHPFYDQYAPTRYGYGGIYGYDYNRPYVVVVQPSSPQTRGRLVKGHGYTQGSSGTAASPRSSVDRPSSSVRAGEGFSAARSRTSTSSKGKAKPRGSGG